jgi:hypothetical protein
MGHVTFCKSTNKQEEIHAARKTIGEHKQQAEEWEQGE